MKKMVVFVFALILLPGVLFSQTDLSNVKIQVSHVAGSVYLLQGSGGNIGLSIGQDGALLVDAEYAPLAEKIKSKVDSLGGGDIKFLINTHGHDDRINGNGEFGNESVIIAQQNVRKQMLEKYSAEGNNIPASVSAALPVITFADSLEIHFNEEDIKLIHYPHSHSGGDIVVYFMQSNVIHMGDLLFSYKFPYIDVDRGGNVQGFLSAISKIINMIDNETVILAGHGETYNKLELTYYLTMLSESVEIIQERMKNEYTLFEMQKLGLPEKFESWGDGFVDTLKWIEIVYLSLGGEKTN